MSLNLTTADAALKEFYLPAVRNQLNNDIPMLQLMETKSVELEGRRTVLSLKVGRNSGIGMRADGGTLPTAGNQQYAEERVSLRYAYGRMQVSGPAISAMKSDKGSFVRAVDSEIKGLTEDVKRDLNRQLWGTSDGKIATCGTTTAAVLVVLAATTTDVQMRQFGVGQKVDIGTVAQAAAGTGGRVHGATIVSIDVSGKTITIDSAITTAATDFVFNAGNGGATTSQKELTGLQTIIAASGALYNIDPSTYPLWKSTVNSNSGTPRAISETLMRKVTDDVSIESGQYPTHGIASHGVQRAYANLLVSLKRFTNTVELKGGYQGIPFSTGGGEIPIIADRDAPSGGMRFPNMNHMFFGKGEDFGWMDEDGAVLSRVPNQDAYEATLRGYVEQFTDQRNAHGSLVDITEA